MYKMAEIVKWRLSIIAEQLLTTSLMKHFALTETHRQRDLIVSKARHSFESSIKDAEEFLEHFDALNSSVPPTNADVLKRAGLVMALTAWEPQPRLHRILHTLAHG